MTGRADYFAPGDWNTVCYQCGRKRKASTLKRHWQGYYVCPEHWEPRQPQDFVRSVQDTQTPPWVQPMPAWTFRAANYTVDLSDSVTVIDAQGFAEFMVIPGAVYTGPVGGQVLNGLVLNGGARNAASGVAFENPQASDTFTAVAGYNRVFTEVTTHGESVTLTYTPGSFSVLNSRALNAVRLG